MEQKRVTFKVAQAIKDAGYSQEETDYYYDYNECIQKRCNCYVNCKCVAPTYLDVWLWVWREKKIHIDVDKDCYGVGCTSFDDTSFEEHNTSDPEESIIVSIEHLCENNLIK